MNKLTKHATVIAMAILLLAQIGIAQHNVVHFTDHAHYENGHDHDHGDHKKNTSEPCQICLLVKSLSLGLTSYHAGLSVPVFWEHNTLKSLEQFMVKHQSTRYNPRAPPSLFI